MAKRACGTRTGRTRVQSLLFPREKFTKRRAKSWASKHGYKTGVDEKPNTYRVRQFDPGACEYRTVPFGTSGIKAVVEVPRARRGRKLAPRDVVGANAPQHVLRAMDELLVRRRSAA